MRGLSPNWLLGTETLHLYIRRNRAKTGRSRFSVLRIRHVFLYIGYISVLRICRVFLIHHDDGRKGDRKDRKEGTERSAGKALKRARRFFEMKKKDFVTLVLSTVGGILFALGMCMGLIPEWDAMLQGVVIGVIGVAVLLIMVLVRRRMDGKPVIVFNAKTVGTALQGTAGAIVFGVGMCMTMIWGVMVSGIVVGIVGIVLLLCLIPLIRGPGVKDG